MIKCRTNGFMYNIKMKQTHISQCTTYLHKAERRGLCDMMNEGVREGREEEEGGRKGRKGGGREG
jgi:hypothetical protein